MTQPKKHNNRVNLNETRFEPFNISGLVRYFLDQGRSVCYMDDNPKRRKGLEKRLSHMDGTLLIQAPVLSDEAIIHYNVLITVNEFAWDEIIRKEVISIPGVENGRMGAHIRLSI